MSKDDEEKRNSKTMGQWLKENIKPHVPTKEQRIVKERLLDSLSDMEAVIDVDTLTMEQIERLTGCGKIRKWQESSMGFLPWLLDKDHQRHKLRAIFDQGIDELAYIIEGEMVPKMLTAKDKISAMQLLANIADKMPSKKKEIMWVDKTVGDMDDPEVDRQLQKVEEKLKLKAPKPEKTIDNEDEL